MFTNNYSPSIAIQLLDQMIKTAKLISTEKDRYDTPGIDSVSEFENRCIIEGELFKIRITVKQQVNRCFAYYFSAIKME
jgi:phospholipid N-methyltransferase